MDTDVYVLKNKYMHGKPVMEMISICQRKAFIPEDTCSFLMKQNTPLAAK